MRPVIAEVNLAAVEHNVKALKALTAPGTKLMAVVKANGYGHGAASIARVALGNGADLLGVAIIKEAIELRQAGIGAPILILGWIPSESARNLIKYELTQAVFTLEQAESLSKTAVSMGKKARVHIKIDTGMNRIGFGVDTKARQDLLKLFRLPGIKVTGVYTHFAEADNDESDFTHAQFDAFIKQLALLENEGLTFPVRHCANSAAIIGHPYTHLDMVRAGLALYGIYPSPSMRKRIHLQPVLSVKTRIVNLKWIGQGDSVSYGRTFVANEKIRVATLPLGYADGYSRLLSNKGRVIINGCYAPVIGTVCMDHLMVDVTSLAGVRVGDEALIIGRDKNGLEVSADEIAEQMSTISYEVICMLSQRVPRIYLL